MNAVAEWRDQPQATGFCLVRDSSTQLGWDKALSYVSKDASSFALMETQATIPTSRIKMKMLVLIIYTYKKIIIYHYSILQ